MYPGKCTESSRPSARTRSTSAGRSGPSPARTADTRMPPAATIAERLDRSACPFSGLSRPMLRDDRPRQTRRRQLGQVARAGRPPVTLHDDRVVQQAHG